MKVLITGGYGFIGSHVADQFYKEGYEVHILDNLSSGKKENVQFKHKSYILSVDDPKCKDIFKSYKFDIVVHLAAQVSVAKSVLSPTNDVQTNLVGLANILQLAKTNHVKKFIFASSAAVYGDNPNIPLNEQELPQPISPYGISKWAGETYCHNWAANHELETICFRFSNVYGPRQTAEGEGGVIAIYTSKLMNNQPLVVHGDGHQTRDFIYVGDVAFAIYRASQSKVSGTYNLSTNTEISIREIIQAFEQIHGSISTNYTEARAADIYRSSLDNTAIKSALDWSPLFSLSDGLQKTYNWAKSLQQIEQEKPLPKPKKSKPAWLQSAKPYIENTLFFILLSTLVMYVSIPILTTFIFGVFYIMTIGSIYGSKQGFLGVVLSFSLLVTENILMGRDVISLMYDTTFLFQIATFLFIGLVVGYSVQRKNMKIAEQQGQLEEIQKRYDFLEEIHMEVRNVKDELQFRIKNNEDSVGKIYSIIKELDNLEPEKIFTNTVQVVEKVMRCQNVSIYVFNRNHSFLRLVAHSEISDNNTLQNSIKVEDSPYIQDMLQNGKIFVNRQLTAGLPLMAAPIFYNNEIHAVITINHLKFEQFSMYHENLLIVVKELIQLSLERAFEFIKMTEDKRYIKDTNVLRYEIFEEIVKTKMEAKQNYNMSYTLFTIPTNSEDFRTTANIISCLLRETDYLSYKDNSLYILLSNTTDKHLPFILNRFEGAGYTINADQKVNML